MESVAGISALLKADPLRWHLMGVVASLDLPDCWIAAGFVRNAVWDHLHRRSPSVMSGDIDVIWFDRDRCDAQYDRQLEARLRRLEPSAHIVWSVKNQARMHARNGDAPYESATDAMRYWPETATAIGARRLAAGDCEIAAPLGLDDLLGLILRPTQGFRERKRAIYDERLRAKAWRAHWPLLTMIDA